MKKYYLLLFTTLFVNVMIYAQEFPGYKLKTTDNTISSVEELKGEKITILDFWATWCKPCVTSIPKINSIYEEFKDSGVQVIGANIDDPRNMAKVKPFAVSIGINYPILLDPNQELLAEYNVTAIPTLVILNHKGEVLLVHEGFNPGDEQLLKQEINQFIKNL